VRVWRWQSLEQQIPFPKLLEHPIPSHAHTRLLQFALEHMVKLARAQARL